MSMLVLALRFLLELCALAALAIGGAELGGVAIAIALPILGAALWSQLAAPRSERRLGDPARLIFEVLFFAGSGAALAVADELALGVALGAAAIVVAVLVRVMPGAREHT